MTTFSFRRLPWLRTATAISAVLTAASGVDLGCSSSSVQATSMDSGTQPGKDSGGSPPKKDSGSPTKDSGSTTKDSGSTTKDSGGPTKDSSTPDAGSTLYSRLGGHAGIRAAVNAVVMQELENADINSYFFFQAGAPGNGHPTPDQIEECFTDFVGSAAGGPETYPTTLSADAGSFTCRDMATIHQPLLISGGTFDTFLMIAGAELASLGVSGADITTLAGALEGTKTAIVNSAVADAGGAAPELYPGDASTHGPDGSAATLYDRLGGHSGIRAAVDAIVGQELTNADLASYFTFQSGAPGNGHPTVDQVEECFTDFVGSAAGGPESYPTTVTDDAGTFTCRDMATIHQPLFISGGTFDTFIMIAGSELTTLGVAPSDITTLASALVGLRPAIVTPALNDGGLQPLPDGGK